MSEAARKRARISRVGCPAAGGWPRLQGSSSSPAWADTDPAVIFLFCEERWSRRCAAWLKGGAEQLVGGKQVQRNIVCLIFRAVIVKLASALLPTEHSNVSQLHHSNILAAREVKYNTTTQNHMYRKTWFIKPMFRANEKELQDIVTWTGA